MGGARCFTQTLNHGLCQATQLLCSERPDFPYSCHCAWQRTFSSFQRCGCLCPVLHPCLCSQPAASTWGGGGGCPLGRSAGMSPIPPAALTAAHLGLVQTLLYAVLGLKSHRGSGLDGHPVIMDPSKTICDFFGHREAGVVGGELKVGAGNHLQGSPHCISMPPLSCAKLDFISYHSEV